MEIAGNLIAEVFGKVDWHAWMLRPVASLSDASNLFFFREINAFLSDGIDDFRERLLGRTLAWVGSMVLTLLTLWIMIQGYRIATGQSRESMMALVTHSLKAVLIIGLATGIAIGGSDIYRFLTDDVSREISFVVTGDDEDAYDNIDRSLGYMQLAMSSIDALHAGGDAIVNDAKDRALWFTGIGIAGPAITGGAMLLLNKIAMALFIGLGPIFILCLLFDQTKQLFSKWLFYGIGTLFSLALLSVMVTLALDLVLAVAAAFWVGSFLGASNEGVTSIALQQGGLGLILTVLILSAPPMAASFFQGVLANFTPYSTIAGSAGTTTAPPPGHPGYPGPQAGHAVASGGPARSEARPDMLFSQRALPSNASSVERQDAVRTERRSST